MIAKKCARKSFSSPVAVYKGVRFSKRTHRNMFNEDEDWNDEEEGQILSKPALSNTKKTSSGINVKVRVSFALTENFLFSQSITMFLLIVVATRFKNILFNLL